MRAASVLCLALLAAPAGADELSDVDVQLLLERLEGLKGGAKGRSVARYEVARDAFEAGIRSDDAAHELYLVCVEKVQFQDEGRKAQEFRDWKRRHDDREDSPEFRRALRHQLNWLLLTLMAAADPEKKDELGAEATKRIDAIFSDAEKLEGEENRLRQDVLRSMFATAYGLNGLKIEEWPPAPLEIAEVYEKLILPPLRRPDRVEALRGAWLKRIEQEGRVYEKWGRASRLAGGRSGRTIEFDRFLAEGRANLLWEMEKDLFRAGDQRGSAKRMLSHIERYLGHKNEEKWIAEFVEIIEGKKEERERALDDIVETEESNP